MLRSIGAVLGGYMSMALLVGLTVYGVTLLPDALQEGTMLGQPWLGLLVIAGSMWAMVGGYVCASIAKQAPFVHVLFLAAFVLCMWFVDVGATPLEVPTWFQVALLFSGVFGVLAGGGWKSWKRRSSAS